MELNNLSHYGDIIALPFFLLLFIYFYKITNKTVTEYILFYFSLGGLIADTFYTYIFITSHNNF